MGIVPGLQATALLGGNMKLLKKPTTKNLLKAGTMNLVGTGFIGATSDMINKL